MATNEDVALFQHTPRGVLFYWGMIMKKLICIVCLLALLLSACSVVETNSAIPEGKDVQGIYELTFKTELVSNNHVGHEWDITYTHNGKTIQSGYTITQSMDVFTFQSIGVEVREDDKIDDVGTGTLKVAICDGGSGKTKVKVRETHGRYKGNTAVWEITCSVKLVGKQSIQK